MHIAKIRTKAPETNCFGGLSFTVKEYFPSKLHSI